MPTITDVVVATAASGVHVRRDVDNEFLRLAGGTQQDSSTQAGWVQLFGTTWAGPEGRGSIELSTPRPGFDAVPVRLQIRGNVNPGSGYVRAYEPVLFSRSVAASLYNDSDETGPASAQIFSPAPGQFALATPNGAGANAAPLERLRINTAGNGGVGTPSPANLLTLKPATNVAQLRLEQDNATDAWTLFASDAGGIFQIARVGAGANTPVTILQYGDVGIGTASPGAKLEVKGTLRLTPVSDTDTADFSVDASGNLTITPSGAEVLLPSGKRLVIGSGTTYGYQLYVAANSPTVFLDAAGQGKATLTLQSRESDTNPQNVRAINLVTNWDGTFTISNRDGQVALTVSPGSPTQPGDVTVAGKLTAGSFNLSGGAVINPATPPANNRLLDAQVGGVNKADIRVASAGAKGEFIIEAADTGDEGGQLRLEGAGSNPFCYIDNFQGRLRVVVQSGGTEFERFAVTPGGDVKIYGGSLYFGETRVAINASGYAMYA